MSVWSGAKTGVVIHVAHNSSAKRNNAITSLVVSLLIQTYTGFCVSFKVSDKTDFRKSTDISCHSHDDRHGT